jgi:hypothetical protein
MFRFIFVLALCFIFTSSRASESIKLRGTVRDRESKELLAYATVRLDGGGTGTITNREGNFIIEMGSGSHTFYVSYIGYYSDSLRINVSRDTSIAIALLRGLITLPEQTVTSDSEDPAYEIIRQAIRRKHENRKGLVNYEYDAYVKSIFETGGNIGSVQESFLKGYNITGRASKEFVLSTRKTENIKRSIGVPPVATQASQDFTEDELIFAKNVITLPLAEHALDFYQYRLLKTYTSGTTIHYAIEVIPTSKLRPLLKGTVYVEDGSFALVGVDLNNNEGIRLPYMRDLEIHYLQVFDKYNGYWLPTYLENTFSLVVNFAGLLSFDKVALTYIYQRTSCRVNVEMPDSIVNAGKSISGGKTADTTSSKRAGKSKRGKGIRIVVVSSPNASAPPPRELTAQAFDSLRPIPLTTIEIKAFAELDSSKTILSMIKPRGALASLATVSEGNDQKKDSSSGMNIMLLLENVEFRNNHATGAFIGGKGSWDSPESDFFGGVRAGYSSGSKRLEWKIGAGMRFWEGPVDECELNLYHQTIPWQGISQLTEFENAVSVLLNGKDRFHYSDIFGFSLSLKRNWQDSLSTSVSFSREDVRSTGTYRPFKFWNRNDPVPINPPVREGKDNRIMFNLQWGTDLFSYSPIFSDGLFAEMTYSHSWLGSDFRYFSAYAAAQKRITTMLPELVLPPYLMMRVDAAIVDGNFGIQHVITPDVAIQPFSPWGTLRGIQPYELAGNKMIVGELEHNWRTLPFQILGLDYFVDLGLDVVTGFNCAKVWNDTPYFRDSLSDKLYWEGFLGLSRVFGFLQIDIGYNSNRRVFGSFRLGAIL